MHSPPKELGFVGKSLQYIEQSLAHWIMANGALAFMVQTVAQGADVKRGVISVRDYIAALDGLVLQGGADLSPESYGEVALQPEWAGDRIRDLFEIELVWECIIQGKPVLGICRGQQLINVACGGTLYQDIALQYPGAAIHRDTELYDGLHHEIVIAENSRLASLYPSIVKGSVNSIHHQAIRTLGSDLIIEAHALDGVIEAIRWTGSSYMFGCQWHPEFTMAFADSFDSSPIMHDFLAAAELARTRSSDS